MPFELIKNSTNLIFIFYCARRTGFLLFLVSMCRTSLLVNCETDLYKTEVDLEAAELWRMICGFRCFFYSFYVSGGVSRHRSPKNIHQRFKLKPEINQDMRPALNQ